MHRIVVVGCSGSGKTTLARELATRLAYPHLELDSVYHQPNWEPLPGDEFRARVAEFALRPQWVIDGNYTSEGIQKLLWPVADTLVWLDPPKRIVMARVIRRTMRRWVTREEMWNGNRESFTGPFRFNPEKSIIRWAWTRYDYLTEKYAGLLAEPQTVHLRVYRLQTRHETNVFLESISSQ